MSASSTTNPVSKSAINPRSIRRPHPSSRRANQRSAKRLWCKATIAVTAAKLNWKLGPTKASGQNSNTTSAPVATNRKVIASRPNAKPPSTSNAAIQERTVGTSAPVSSV